MNFDDRVMEYWKKKHSFLDSMCSNDIKFSKFRDKLEKKHLFREVKFDKNMIVLDLGCGAGRWSFPFAEKCKEVVAVDISPGFIDVASNIKKNKGIDNVTFFCQSIINFSYLGDKKFDVVHLGGVLQYLNADSVEKLVSKLYKVVKKDGILISRDSVNFSNTRVCEVNDYICISRLKEDLLRLFVEQKFILIYCNDSFLSPFFTGTSSGLYNFVASRGSFIFEELDFLFLNIKVFSYLFRVIRGSSHMFHIFKRS